MRPGNEKIVNGTVKNFSGTKSRKNTTLQSIVVSNAEKGKNLSKTLLNVLGKVL